MLAKIYMFSGIGLLLFYSGTAAFGWDLGPGAPPQKLPPDVRHSPGGYRAFHSGYSGFRGGK
jgi:hypothetical protein